MTRETKLGLVVGGVFILCFSMILSHAEDGQIVESELNTLALTSQAAPAFGLAAGGGSEPDSVWFSPQTPSDNRRAQLAPPLSVLDGPSENIAPLNLPSGQKADAPAGWMAESETRQSPSPNTPSSPFQVADATIKNRPLPGSEPVNVLSLNDALPPPSSSVQSIVAAVNAPPWSGSSAERPALHSRQQPTTPPDPVNRPRDAQIYVVGQGDSLSKIARKFYGSSEGHMIERVYEANRRLLLDKDALRVGQELVIPDVDKPAEAAARKNMRWYRVQPKDRYTTIAQAQLGTSKRWKEIHQLNQDIFPDPDQIRPGVRIRLPAE